MLIGKPETEAHYPQLSLLWRLGEPDLMDKRAVCDGIIKRKRLFQMRSDEANLPANIRFRPRDW
jgi:hypothetical protein